MALTAHNSNPAKVGVSGNAGTAQGISQVIQKHAVGAGIAKA
jgi:hypothetical protein